MCLAFVAYYPALPISTCLSGPPYSKVSGIMQKLKSTNWNIPSNKEELVKISKLRDLNIKCHNGNSAPYQVC